MFSYVLKRVLMLIPIALVASTLVFVLSRAALPSDPVDFILGDSAMPQDAEFLRKQLHLDESISKQYVTFLKGTATFDWGESIFKRQKVINLIGAKILATVELTIAAMLVAILIAIPLGILAALKKGTYLDLSAMTLSLLGISMPHFWLGPILILIFAVHLNWFPVSGRELAGSIVLPAITLGTALAAMLSRMTRSSMLEVLKAEYITTARAKGVAEWKVIVKHALKNALNPIITILGLQFGALLAGAVVTEKIFSWPGIGSLFLDAIFSRDYPLIQGCVLIIVFSYVIVNTITDCLYKVVDPRVRLS